MNKTLITKLNGVVNNDNILKLGEMRIRIAKVANPTDATQGFSITVNKPVTAKIIGDGYFTNKSLSVNLGNTMNLNTGSNGIWVSNDDVKISIIGKYSITEFTSSYPGQSSSVYGENIGLDLSSFKYSTFLTGLDIHDSQVSGNIEDLKDLTAMSYLGLYNTQVSGDIKVLKNLTNLTFLGLHNTQVSGDIGYLKNLALSTLSLSNTQVSGDIKELKDLTTLTSFTLPNTQVMGDIGYLKNLTALTSLSVFNIKVPLTGDIGDLSTLTKCEDITLQYSKLTGDLATLPASCQFISFKNDMGSSFTWGTRASSSKIVAIEGNARLANIDKMLQDQAQCQVGSDPSNRIISVVGNRTSASDAAVKTLQQNGYTVSITPA